jgi:hypothetical protein
VAIVARHRLNLSGHHFARSILAWALAIVERSRSAYMAVLNRKRRIRKSRINTIYRYVLGIGSLPSR